VKAIHNLPPPPPVHETVVERIARVCHEVNRAYCQALGDDSQKPWDQAPDWQRKSAVNGVVMHLANPTAGPQASHEAWMREKLENGWTWGPVKDEVAHTHPCIMDFAKLPPEQRAKDYLFHAVAINTATALGLRLATV
jgi:hypothetical protein